MSLVFFRNTAQDLSGTWALIKEKTEVEITPVSESGSNNSYKVNVRFPDMEQSVELPLKNVNHSGYIYNWLIFVDIENHFLAIIEPLDNTSNYYPSHDSTTVNYEQWIKAIIFENITVGELCSFSTYDSRSSQHAEFNIVKYPDKTIREKIIVYPMYFTSSNKAGYAKNMFLNCERMFEPALKFIDQNGNKFVTLGGYILYKVD